MSTGIILIRHGETDWNHQGRIQGHLPVPLNARGMAQAKALATHLQGESLDAVYSSDLLRARQTAEAIARINGQEIRLDERLREWDLGMLSGMFRTDAERDHPEVARIYQEYLVDQVIPNGESIRQRYERITAAVSEIASQHPDQRVVVVSHGGPLGDCYHRAVGKEVSKRLQIDLFNASINCVQIDDDRWEVESWGGIDHLASIGSLANWEGQRRNR